MVMKDLLVRIGVVCFGLIQNQQKSARMTPENSVEYSIIQ